jgi:hypothetical protein
MAPGRCREQSSSPGGWDLRPHISRIVNVTLDVLADWSTLTDQAGTPPNKARLLLPTTQSDNEGLRRLSQFSQRLGDFGFRWTSSFHEKGAKRAGFIEWRTHVPKSWNEAVLQGPHFTVANPFDKQPNSTCRSSKDYSSWSLIDLPEQVIPRTNYVRSCSLVDFTSAQPMWGDKRASEHFRVAWRRMVDPIVERTLQAALIPPGPTHVDAVHTLALQTNRETVVVGGLWSAMPLDYLVKVSGASKVNMEMARNFPAPLIHPLTTPLILRTLRLNCLTRDFASLWQELYQPSWADDRWTAPEPLGARIQEAESTWSMASPLRSDYDRRMALVEIDAVVAVMLGLTAQQMRAMYRSQFGTLRKYEWEMFFAPDGHKIGAATHNVGVRQTDAETKFVKAWAKAARAGDPTPAVPEGWVKPNREAEMTRAHADFTARLLAGEYGDYAAYAAEHGDHGNLLSGSGHTDAATTADAPEGR